MPSKKRSTKSRPNTERIRTSKENVVSRLITFSTKGAWLLLSPTTHSLTRREPIFDSQPSDKWVARYRLWEPNYLRPCNFWWRSTNDVPGAFGGETRQELTFFMFPEKFIFPGQRRWRRDGIDSFSDSSVNLPTSSTDVPTFILYNIRNKGVLVDTKL